MRKSLLYSITALVGIGITAFISAKAGIKIDRKVQSIKTENPEATTTDIIKEVMPEAAPAVVAAVITGATIIANDKKLFSDISSTSKNYTDTYKKFHQYKSAAKKLLGPQENKIWSEITRETVHPLPTVNKKKDRIYDNFSGQWFEAEQVDVWAAFYEAQCEFNRIGTVYYNAFITAVGGEAVPEYYGYVWDCEWFGDMGVEYIIGLNLIEDHDEYGKFYRIAYSWDPVDIEHTSAEWYAG